MWTLVLSNNFKRLSKNMTRKSPPPDKLGRPLEKTVGAWVQTDRKAHELWAKLAMSKPRASALMHLLVAKMGHQNAVVVPQKVLAKLMGAHERTVQRAVADLVSDNWIEVIRLNGAGTICAYVVNDRVAWGQPRDQLRLSVFSAAVVADYDDQEDAKTGQSLRQIPVLFSGERQLPSGPGEDPPAQPALDGLEHDLPNIQR